MLKKSGEKMIVYICCAGGGSSSMFCLKIAAAAKETALNVHFSDLTTILANQGEFTHDYDLVFAYGPIDAINQRTAPRFSSVFDGILVCPQVRYLTASKQALMKELNVAVKDVDSLTFGRMEGSKALDVILNDLAQIDLERSGFAPSQQHQGLKNRNLTIFISGGEEKSRFFTSMVAELGENGIRVLSERLNPNTFYEGHLPANDYDIRFLFGTSEDINERTFVDFAKEIDLVLITPMNRPIFREKQALLATYHIPSADIDMVSFGRMDGRRGLQLLEEDLVAAYVTSEFDEQIDYFNMNRF